MKLPPQFYHNNDVVMVARELIGKVLCVADKEGTLSGIITETEAYNGIIDKASHAYGGRNTARTEVMFGEGGHAYVYLCYGIHRLFNVVTNFQGIPHAVLIRSIIPLDRAAIQLKRRNAPHPFKGFDGPGKVTSSLNIGLNDNGVSLVGERIWIENRNIKIDSKNVDVTARIGVEYAGEDALLPYRFVVKNGRQLVNY